MTLLKRNPVMAAVPSFFDDIFTRDLLNWDNRGGSSTNSTLPSVNIVENNDSFKVEMAAPGMSKKDFQIELDNEMLTISSEKKTENELNEGDSYNRREFSYQSFKRTFHMPKSVVELSKIEASYKDGILRIMIPKKEEAKSLPPRRIAIK